MTRVVVSVRFEKKGDQRQLAHYWERLDDIPSAGMKYTFSLHQQQWIHGKSLTKLSRPPRYVFDEVNKHWLAYLAALVVDSSYDASGPKDRG